MPREQSQHQLAAGLKRRHVTMLSMAGVIGAGLFIGSGHAIAAAGPAVLIAYALAGLLVILIMRMLGEMAVASPDTGSFSTYAERAIGPWAGFSIGWLYWWFWVLVIPLEATAAATILNSWFSMVPTWVFALGITSTLTITNLFSVKNYGEFEFWFALLKVGAIVLFLLLGAAAIFGLLPTQPAFGVGNLFGHGGFMPHGIGAVFSAMLTTMFTFLGTEIVTIAAAESKNPDKQIASAMNAVIWRICLFYLGSIVVIVAIVPWNDPLLASHGAYQRTLEILDIPWAKQIIDMVVLVAVASCLNSALYTSSRMLFSLARRGDAPAILGRTHSNSTPVPAVLASTLIGFLAVIANYAAPAYVFSTLLASSGAIALLVYLVIALSQLFMRKKLEQPLQFRMWLFPWLTLATIALISGVFLFMAISPYHQAEVLSSGVLATIVVLISLLRRKPAAPENLALGQKTSAG